MESKNILADVDFERDAPTTAEDVAALNAARERNHLSPQAYLDFLTETTEGVPASRKIKKLDEPFEL